MECNREEALRAKEMAELKFASQDFATAKKFAQKAFHLYPDLDNIQQMLSVIDVHIAAQVQICRDEKDWYAILQVEPTADDASIRRQYKKLALFLHPDKNKSIGAESAFKLIGEAFQVLCDKTRRLVHDAKRGLAGKTGSAERSSGIWNAQWHGQPESGAHSAASKEQQWKQHQHQHQHQEQQHHHQSFQQAFTFWTACPSCQMRYQYYRTYENQNLLCPHCRRPFIAKELSHLQRNNVTQGWPPPKFEHGGYYSSENCGAVAHTSINGFSSGMGRSTDVLHRYSWFPDQVTTASASKNGPGYSTSYFSEAAYQEVARTQRTFALFKEDLKRKREQEELARKEIERQKKAKILQETHEKAQKHAAKAFAKEKKKKGKKYESSASSSSGEEEDWEKVAAEHQNLKGCPRRSSRSKKSMTYTADMSDDGLKEAFASKKAGTDNVSGVIVGEDLERSQMKLSLAKLARELISEKLKKFYQQKNMDSLGKITRVIPSAHGLQKGPLTKPRSNSQGSSRKKKESPLKKSNTYTVPDADFHNFDEGREEKDIEAGQIWALYDEEDGFPRYYIRVKEVLTRSPFKVSISWLELRKPSEKQRELQDKGLSLTCGEFRSSFSQTMSSVNSFSHLIKWEKGTKGIYRIFPLKGQVWAVYKDWEIGQLLVKLKYSMVEILSDCTEETGVSVMILEKVEGFKTLFQLSKGESMQIPFSELLRFSHQVPGHKLVGDEAPSIPEGCWELDPASVPLSLIYSDASPRQVK